MSGYTVQVSGPSARLAMLRALAHKLFGRLTHLWAAVKVTISSTARVAKAATTTGLAVIGSQAGYQLVRHGVRALVTGAVRLASSGLRFISRGLHTVGRVALTAVATVSPTAADLIEHTTHQWVVQPVHNITTKVVGWVRDVAAAVWDLSDTGLVRTVTVRAAQAASLILALHTITKGAAASKVVQALPWAMDAVITVTNPAKAAALVATVFAAAVVVAAMRVLDTEGPDDEPDNLEDIHPLESTRPQTPQLRPVPEPPKVDLREVAAQLNVEVTADGSVLVHGIPDELPDDLGLDVAQVAAKAATERLERILLRKPFLNRDDRRLLTKVAREAVRNRGPVHAAS